MRIIRIYYLTQIGLDSHKSRIPRNPLVSLFSNWPYRYCVLVVIQFTTVLRLIVFISLFTSTLVERVEGWRTVPWRGWKDNHEVNFNWLFYAKMKNENQNGTCTYHSVDARWWHIPFIFSSSHPYLLLYLDYLIRVQVHVT